jgi:hypothetical protein
MLREVVRMRRDVAPLRNVDECVEGDDSEDEPQPRKGEHRRVREGTQTDRVVRIADTYDLERIDIHDAPASTIADDLKKVSGCVDRGCLQPDAV